MIAHLSYVMCDACGNPAQPGDDAEEARAISRREGYTRQRGTDGKQRDLCRACSGEAGRRMTAPPRRADHPA